MRAQRGPRQVLLLLCLYSSCILAQNAADYEKALELALRYASEREAQYNKELLDLVSIPSISTLSERAGDVRKAAEWLHARLRQAGLQQVEILETGAQPVVFAASEHQSGQPTVLIYGHYDVQPAAPESEWDTPPFKPVLKDGVFYGRGVDDDKGGLLQALQAVEAAVRTSELGLPPVNVKVMLEGQEEVGSPNLAAFLQQHKEKLACDLAFSADGGQISSQQGGIPIGLRGAVALEVTLTTSSSEHHSGVVGGSIQNAVHAMTQLLSTLRFANGSIAIDGFYEGLAEISEQDRLDEAAFPFDEAAEMESLGVQGFIGEEGFSTLQRRWLRPTVEVVGVSGGYTGAGIQNVVPKAATAKINSRLVAYQRPEEVLAKIQQHLHKHQPPFTNLTITPFGFQAQPYVMPRDSPAAKLAGKVLEDVMGSPPLFYRGGGTIPAMALMRNALGVDMAMLAFGLPGDRIHAPNERFPQSMFDMGRRAYIQLLFEVQAAVLAFGLPDDRIHGANERYPQRMYQLGRRAYIRLLFEAARPRPEPEAADHVEL